MNMKKILSLLIILSAVLCWSQEKTVPQNVIYYTNAPSKIIYHTNTPSKKELFSRARDVLKKSLENKNFEQAGEAYAYLKENVTQGAPLTVFEEYLIDMEMGHYEDGVRKYAGQRRKLLDSTYVIEKDDRITENDVLHKYLYGKFEKFTEQKADSLVNLVDASNVSTELKDLYAAMIYGELTVGIEVFSYRNSAYLYRGLRDTVRVEQFLARAHKFVVENPYTEHTNYLKNQIIPMVEKIYARVREFRKNPFKHKYYTGGLGIFAGLWTGFMSGEITEHVETKKGSSIMLEATLQMRRISLNVFCANGFMNIPMDYDYRWEKVKDETVGLSVGFTAFDSRFFRAEPFLGVGSYEFKNVDMDESSASTTFLLGLNADVRLFATRPKRYGGPSFDLVARLKYMAMFGSYTDNYYDSRNGNVRINADFVSHHFAISLGAFLW